MTTSHSNLKGGFQDSLQHAVYATGVSKIFFRFKRRAPSSGRAASSSSMAGSFVEEYKQAGLDPIRQLQKHPWQSSPQVRPACRAAGPCRGAGPCCTMHLTMHAVQDSHVNVITIWQLCTTEQFSRRYLEHVLPIFAGA